MVDVSKRKQIQNKLDQMTDEQLAEVLRYIEVIKASALPKDYDEDSDPSVGFFSASSDYASRSKDVLDEEFGIKKPFTPKADE